MPLVLMHREPQPVSARYLVAMSVKGDLSVVLRNSKGRAMLIAERGAEVSSVRASTSYQQYLSRKIARTRQTPTARLRF